MYILHLAFKINTTFLRLSLLTHIAPVHVNAVQYFTVGIYHVFKFY